MTADHDQVSLPLMLNGFQRDYPGWVFAVRHRFDGPHLEAYRPRACGGLYAVITADPAELRQELDNATTTHDSIRPHDVKGMTTGQLERSRRELAASLALARPGSPSAAPTLALMRAIDAELTKRNDY